MATGRAVSLIAALVLAGLAAAAAAGGACAADGAPYPEIPRGKGEACVRETAFMRSNHMKLLLHQRDLTVHEGIRPERERLEACLACHAVRDAAGRPVGFESPRHFCRTCHDYAAVRIDCFQCHDSRPQDREGASRERPEGAGLRLSGLGGP